MPRFYGVIQTKPRRVADGFNKGKYVVTVRGKELELEVDWPYVSLRDAVETATSYVNTTRQQTVVVPFNGYFYVGYN